MATVDHRICQEQPQQQPLEDSSSDCDNERVDNYECNNDLPSMSEHNHHHHYIQCVDGERNNAIEGHNDDDCGKGLPDSLHYHRACNGYSRSCQAHRKSKLDSSTSTRSTATTCSSDYSSTRSFASARSSVSDDSTRSMNSTIKSLGVDYSVRSMNSTIKSLGIDYSVRSYNTAVPVDSIDGSERSTNTAQQQTPDVKSFIKSALKISGSRNYKNEHVKFNDCRQINEIKSYLKYSKDLWWTEDECRDTRRRQYEKIQKSSKYYSNTAQKYITSMLAAREQIFSSTSTNDDDDEIVSYELYNELKIGIGIGLHGLNADYYVEHVSPIIQQVVATYKSSTRLKLAPDHIAKLVKVRCESLTKNDRTYATLLGQICELVELEQEDANKVSSASSSSSSTTTRHEKSSRRSSTSMISRRDSSGNLKASESSSTASSNSNQEAQPPSSHSKHRASRRSSTSNVTSDEERQRISSSSSKHNSGVSSSSNTSSSSRNDRNGQLPPRTKSSSSESSSTKTRGSGRRSSSCM